MGPLYYHTTKNNYIIEGVIVGSDTGKYVVSDTTNVLFQAIVNTNRTRQYVVLFSGYADHFADQASGSNNTPTITPLSIQVTSISKTN